MTLIVKIITRAETFGLMVHFCGRNDSCIVLYKSRSNEVDLAIIYVAMTTKGKIFKHLVRILGVITVLL